MYQAASKADEDNTGNRPWLGSMSKINKEKYSLKLNEDSNSTELVYFFGNW